MGIQRLSVVRVCEHEAVSPEFSLPSTRGRLLVASPPLVDPNFDRTVVFMLEHSAVGALGVVLNRPSGREMEIDVWKRFVAPPHALFAGGPVDTEILIGLGLLPASDGIAVESIEFIDSIDLTEDPNDLDPAPVMLRVFHGYSGWGPGQLDDELESGAWIVVDATTRDVFSDEPRELWRTVLARQSGRLAWLTAVPRDPSMN